MKQKISKTMKMKKKNNNSDSARQRTDKHLQQMEREIGRIYENSPALKRIQKKYMAFMDEVNAATEDAYKAYKNETDVKHKAELKKAYTEQVKELTLRNKKYKAIVTEYTHVMAEVNQQAIEYTNRQMKQTYIDNYNQVAVDCKEAGIKVNGKD